LSSRTGTAWWIYTLPNPAAGSPPGAMIFAGSGNGRTGQRRLIDRDNSAWGPRLGFAYALGARTVLRGGYGLYYADNYLSISSAGFNIEGTFQTLDNGITPAFRLRDGFARELPEGAADRSCFAEWPVGFFPGAGE
jgi:hypothetical protein